MGIVHGLSINQGKLDVQFADSDFYKEKDNSIKINPVVFEEPLKQVPIGTALKRDATTGEISLAIGADMVNHGPLDFDDERKLIFKYGDGLKTDADTHALKVDRDALATFISEEIAKLLANADENYDTLQEIAAYISSDATNAAQITNDIYDLKANKQDTISLGSGLLFDTDGNLSVLTGKGFVIDPVTNEIKLDLGTGLYFDSDKLTFNMSDIMGGGLKPQADGKLTVNVGNGLRYGYHGNLEVDLEQLVGDGLIANQNSIIVNYCDVGNHLLGVGLVKDGYALNVDYGNIVRNIASTGLAYNDTKLVVKRENGHWYDGNLKDGNPLVVSDQGITLKLGNGLNVSCDNLEIKATDITGHGLFSENNHLHVDGSALIHDCSGLKIINKYIFVKTKPRSGLIVSASGLRIGSGDVSLSNEATDGRSDADISAVIDFNDSEKIVFKLSTGLAVDDNGRLYVDVEKIAQLANSTQTTNEA